MQPCQEDSRSFFEKLQNAEGLDLRDNRGRRHALALVLTGVTLALLANRDGNLSSIHRHLENHYERLMWHLELETRAPISRAQLSRVLEKVSVAVFVAGFRRRFYPTESVCAEVARRKKQKCDGEKRKANFFTIFEAFILFSAAIDTNRSNLVLHLSKRKTMK